jgi:hypothetical protein
MINSSNKELVTIIYEKEIFLFLFLFYYKVEEFISFYFKFLCVFYLQLRDILILYSNQFVCPMFILHSSRCVLLLYLRYGMHYKFEKTSQKTDDGILKGSLNRIFVILRRISLNEKLSL